MVSRPYLDLVTIAPKTDSNKPMYREFCKSPKILDYTEIFLHANCWTIVFGEKMKVFMLLEPDFEDQIQKRFGDSGGVYWLRCVEEKGQDKFVRISRAIDNDDGGILYIGKAERLQTRLKNLRRCIDHKSKKHICGRRYNSNSNLKKKFPLNRLCVSVKRANNPEELEKKNLDKYFKKYGDLPPLNRQV